MADKAAGLIEVEGPGGRLSVPYRVERSARRKRMALQMEPGPLLVVKLPGRMSLREGMVFLEENRSWVAKQAVQELGRPSLWDYLEKQPLISGYGERWRVQWERSLSHSVKMDPMRREVWMRSPERPINDWVLVRYCRTVAERLLPPQVGKLAERHGLAVHGVTIRDQKSRWGSCSETGRLSLNWRLVLLEPELQDHVLLHELAHLRHFDHSADFHRTLEEWDAQAPEHRKRLRERERAIMPLGRGG